MESSLAGGGAGRELSPSTGGANRPAAVGSGDGRSVGGGERRANPEPTRLSQRLLLADVDHARGQAAVAGAAGPAGTLSHGGFRALPAERESAGGGAGGDVHPRGIDAQGQGDHRAIVRTRVLGRDGEPDQSRAG